MTECPYTFPDGFCVKVINTSLSLCQRIRDQNNKPEGIDSIGRKYEDEGQAKRITDGIYPGLLQKS